MAERGTEMKTGRASRLVSLGGLAAGMAGDAAAAVAMRGAERAHRAAAERMAAALGQMRGLPHKLGQVLSSLEGVLPAEHREVWVEVLGRLQAKAEPLPWLEVEPLMRAALGAELAEVFAEVEPVAAASASIGQVHRGRLLDGRQVAIKLRLPGIEAAIRADLANIGSLVGSVSSLLPRTSVEHLIAEVSERLLEELDYEQEGRSQARWAERWAGEGYLVVPTVRLARPELLVTDWVEGLGLEQARLAGAEQRSAWGLSLWRMSWFSLARDAELHGDPHPGNFVFLPEGRVALLDFGCTQTLDVQTPRGLLEVARLYREGASDRALLEPLTRALGLPSTLPEPVVRHLAGYSRTLMEPIGRAQPYAFSAEATARLMEHAQQAKAQMIRHGLLSGMPVPQARGTTILMRSSVGMAALLGRLRAEADFAAAVGLSTAER